VLRWCLGFLLSCVMAAAALCAERGVTVFAASSLTDALQDAGRDFEAASGTKVTFSFAGSSLLARQIEAGADADIFFSADVAWMDYLQQRKLIRAASRRDVLSNRLALIAPAGSTVGLQIKNGFGLAAALGDGKLALADPETGPAGRYAKAALTTLGVWDAVAPKVVRAENVRVALAYVARAEAELGIVYATDAKAEPGVRVVDLFPSNTHPRIVYPAALTAHGSSAEARAFFVYMIGEKAAATFERYGFAVVAPAR